MIISGNVGIGTADPGSYRLKVQGDANLTVNLKVDGGGAFGGYSPSATHKVTTPTLYAEQAQIGNPTGGLKGSGSLNTSQLCLEGVCYSSWGAIGGSSGWTDDGASVRLTTAGDKVGIGTAGPGTSLHVRKDVAGIYTGLFTGTNDYGVYIGKRDADTWGT